jgi:hypothetical protein
MRIAPLLVFLTALQAQQPNTLATVSISGLVESSGIAASRKHPGVFWSHNDNEGGPYLYAFDRAGRLRGKVRVTRATMCDWEDIAIGPRNQIYIGDIGDNDHARKEIVVYRIDEPEPEAANSTPVHALRLRYPDGPHDAETLLVHPKTGDIYIVTKARGRDSRTRVYKAPASAKSPSALKYVADVEFPNESVFSLVIGRITGGAISPDGNRVVLCDYFRAWEAIVADGNFDSVWRQSWRSFDIGKRMQGEAICYRHDGKAVLVTSEGENFPLIEVDRKH